MKAKRIFTSKAALTLYFMAFLEDHRALGAFRRCLRSGSVKAYCSRFYDLVSDGIFTFEAALSAAFPWEYEDASYWRRLSRIWIKFIHSK